MYKEQNPLLCPMSSSRSCIWDMAAGFQRLEPFNGGQKFSDRKSQGVSHFHPMVTASCFCMSSLYCSSVPDIENLNLETRQCSVAQAKLSLAWAKSFLHRRGKRSASCPVLGLCVKRLLPAAELYLSHGCLGSHTWVVPGPPEPAESAVDPALGEAATPPLLQPSSC